MQVSIEILSKQSFEFQNEIVKRYGTYLVDNDNEETNIRRSVLKYKDMYFGIIMQHGEVINVIESQTELNLLNLL